MKTLEQLNKLVTELSSTSKSNAKKQILVDNDSPEIREILLYVYDKMNITFGITSKNAKKNGKTGHYVYGMYQLLDMLANRELTGHRAANAVVSFAEDCGYPELFYRIIDRDLKVRTGSSVINKIYDNLIPKFEVALAESYYKVNKKNIPDFEKDEWVFMRKLDGCVDYDSTVEFEDGTKMKIGEVVDNNINGNIKSFNIETKEVEFKPIISNFSEDSNNDTEWYEIEFSNGISKRITGNDRVWLPELECYRRVDELKDGDVCLYEN